MTLSRTSPAFDSHVQNQAEFQEKNGWRRVDFFHSNAHLGDATRTPGDSSKTSWSPAVEAEHRSVRERVGLFDLTSFGKIRVLGHGAADYLEEIYPNRVVRGTGRVTYTQMLNHSGGVIGDVTVAQTGDRDFFIVTGTSALEHDLAWLHSQAANFRDVSIVDVTSAWACFGVWGPQSREVLAPLVSMDLDSKAFPYMATREGLFNSATIRMSRVTFVGELGWEIYLPSEYGRSAWTALSHAVREIGGLHCGYKAIDSLRCEKGYLYLGADLVPQHTPAESGTDMFVRTDKSFIGHAALEARSGEEVRLAALTLDDIWVQLQGGEEVRRNGEVVGSITSGGLGFTVGKSVGFAFLACETNPGDALTVRIGGVDRPATVAKQPIYDPSGSKIRV